MTVYQSQHFVEQKKKRLNVADLQQLYIQGDQADREVFGDQRSNILLVSGDHYTRKNARYWNRLRENRHLSQEQKLRLTKNHVQRITKHYVNNIINHAPGVAILPHNEKEAQDRKNAELCQAIWIDAKRRLNYKDKVLGFAKDFIEMGETATKIFWNPDKGKIIGYNQATKPNGEPLFEMDEQGEEIIDPQTGQPVPKKDPDSPVFEGEFEIERIHGFNLVRKRGSQTMDESPWLCVRKMVYTPDVKEWVRNDPEKMRKVTSSTDQTYYVFEGSRNGYDKATDHTLVMEFYFRPSPTYPEGYYYIATRDLILFEGPLPFGIWPIRYVGFDEVQTSPRHRSIIKQLRPYQIEINRAASKIAEHQVTLGDDKLLVQSGSKLTEGINLPGVRAMQYTGRDPIILAGRAGDQYVAYMQGQIEEMYRVANMKEDAGVKTESGQKANDPWGQMFKSLRDKKRFSIYAEKFERHLVSITELFLDLAKNYYDENRLIPMVGRNEYANISEFKNTQPNSYSINVEPRTEDIETLMGKQLSINTIMQYSGGQLKEEDIGKMIRNMPFANLDESFNDLTMDYDMGTNMILALDRGEPYQPNPYDEHKYMLKRLIHRMRQADFKLLDPQIQQLYAQAKDMYMQMEEQQQRQLLAAQAQFIPTGGAKVKCDFYVPKVTDPTKSERALIPAEALQWLLQRMEDQGTSQEQLQNMNQGALQEMAQKLLQNQASANRQGQ